MTTPTRRLVLVGAGHAHVEVLRAAAQQAFDAELVLVSPSAQQLYSGMMPGQLSGQWPESALTIDVPALCRAAGARFVESSAVRIDATAVTVEVECANGERVGATHASCDIGATPIGLELSGVRAHAHRTRPVEQWRALIARADVLAHADTAVVSTRYAPGPVIPDATSNAASSASFNSTNAVIPCCVVGGGAAGVELALALAQRFSSAAKLFNVTLLSASGDVPTGFSGRVTARVQALLTTRRIRVLHSARVLEVTAAAVVLDDGRSIESDFTVWTTGAAAPSLFRDSALPCDGSGFLTVDETLRATSGVPVWGAGDCIAMASAPWMTRSGVYAVRAAPVLAHNLRVACSGVATGVATGGSMRSFVPQRQTMFILDTADGAALLCRGSIAVHSRWALWLKRWIDRQFVKRYVME